MKNSISSLAVDSSGCPALVVPNMPGSGLETQRPGSAHMDSRRQRDLDRRVAIILILLCFLPASTLIRADENPAHKKLVDEKLQPLQSVSEQGYNASSLDGKRLFFDHEQRRGFKSNAENLVGSSSDSLSNDAANDSDSVTAVEPQTSVAIVEPVTRNETIRYHARIEGWELIRVIVNGLPCDAVSRYDLARRASGTALTCMSIIEKRLELLLLTDGTTIQVMEGKRVKGIITPGGSL